MESSDYTFHQGDVDKYVSVKEYNAAELCWFFVFLNFYLQSLLASLETAIAKSVEVKNYQELKAMLPAEVASAVITSNGQLSPPYHYHRPTDETGRV